MATCKRAERLDGRARQAVAADRDDLARVALARKHDALARQEDLERQLADVAGDEQRLIAAEQLVARRVEDSARQRHLLLARYTAAEAQARTAETLAGLATNVADLSAAVERAGERTDRLRARASALDALLSSGALGAPAGSADDIDRELRRLDSERAVEDDLAALKQSVSQ